jgi:hypothetical protein
VPRSCICKMELLNMDLAPSSKLFTAEYTEGSRSYATSPTRTERNCARCVEFREIDRDCSEYAVWESHASCLFSHQNDIWQTLAHRKVAQIARKMREIAGIFACAMENLQK